MGERLLTTHFDPVADAARIKQILDMLTEKFYFHGYSISRSEAKDDVGLNVVYPEQKLEDAIWELYLRYQRELRMDVPALSVPATAGAYPLMVDSAVIETTDHLHVYTHRGQATVTSPTNKPLEVQIQTGGEWRKHP